MSASPLVVERTFKAPLEKVWRAITELSSENFLEGWTLIIGSSLKEFVEANQ